MTDRAHTHLSEAPLASQRGLEQVLLARFTLDTGHSGHTEPHRTKQNHTNRQTDNRQIERQTEPNRQASKETNSQVDRQTDDRYADRQKTGRDRQTNKQTS